MVKVKLSILLILYIPNYITALLLKMNVYSLKKFKLSLYTSIAIFILLLIVISSYDCYLKARQELEKQVNILSSNVKAGVDNYFNYIKSIMNNVATNITTNNDLHYINSLFENSSKAFQHDFIKIDNFVFIDAHNRGVVSSDIGVLPRPINYSQDMKFLMNNTYNTGKVNTCGKLYNSRINEQRSIAFSIAINDAQSQYLGTVLYDLSISDLFRYIKSFVKNDYVGFILSDYYGKNIIRYPINKKIMSKHYCKDISLFLTYKLLLCYDNHFVKNRSLSGLPSELLKILLVLLFISVMIYYINNKIFNSVIALADRNKIASNIVEIENLSQCIERYYRTSENLDNLQKQLIKKDMEADTAHNTKLEFIACISHELRTPLNAIITFSDIIKQQTFGLIENKQYVEYGNDIYEAGNRLLLMVDNILYLSKIEAGMADLTKEEVDIINVIDTALSKFACDIDEKQISVEKMYSNYVPLILLDKKKIILVISYIISNAIKFNNRGGNIEIKVTYLENKRENGLTISITDTGIGIQEENQTKLFMLFGMVKNNNQSDINPNG